MAKLVTWDELIKKAKAAGNISSAKALEEEKKKYTKTNTAKPEPVNEFQAWNTQNQQTMQDYTKYAYDLSQYYLDEEERYLSMASDAQREANEFNAEQAQIQRDWSEAMSATAHQREVADLRAAGLNPIISAYGSGASVGSGAAATSSNNLTSAFGTLASQALGAVASLANTMETNATSYANAGLQYTIGSRQADVQQYAAELSAQTNMNMNYATNQMNKYIAEINQMNQKDIARIAADANVTSAEVHAAASNYASEIAYASAIDVAAMNNQTSKEIAEMQVNKTFEGLGTSVIQKAARGIMDWLKPEKAY